MAGLVSATTSSVFDPGMEIQLRRIVSWLTAQSFRRAGIVLLATVLVLAIGVYSAFTVKQELLPDFELPFVTVIVQSPGDQASTVANSIIAPIEASTSELDGLRTTQSTSVDGLGIVLYVFDIGTSTDNAERQIRDGLSTLDLPPGASTRLLAFDPTILPIVVFDLSGDLSQAELQQIAEQQLVPAMSDIDGVANVSVTGGAFDQVLITLDRQQLLDQGIAYESVANALQSNNVILPSGQLTGGDTTVPVQTIALLTSLDDIKAIPIPTAHGTMVPLSDIAQVEQITGVATGISRTNGQPSISVQITKEKTANTVAIGESVVETLDRIEPELPEGVSVSVFSNQADMISDSIDSVVEEGIIGGILAIIVVFLFLRNWRTTIITAVSIPVSLLVAVTVLSWLGYSLNIMTLAGLTIAIGRVIDDTIVVLENVYRHMSAGQTPIDAIREGAREVTIAILGATAVTCAVFLPLGLTGGIIGALFLPFAIAVVAALLASLLVAVTLVPTLSRFLLAGKVRPQSDTNPQTGLSGRIYRPTLNWALDHRWITLGIAGALFIGSLLLVPFLPVSFLPDSGENTVTITVDARPGETAQAVSDRALEVERLLVDRKVERYQTVITGAGADLAAIGNLLSGTSPNSATITADLGKGVDKQETAEQLRADIASQIADPAGITVSTSSGMTGSSGVAVTVSTTNGADPAALAEFAGTVAAAVSDVDHVVNVSSNLSATQPTTQIIVDPQKAAAAGLSPQQISQSVANLSSVATLTMVTLDGKPYPVRMLVGGADTPSIDNLGALELVPGVRLDQVATLSESEVPVSITRIDGREGAQITADIVSDDVGGVSTAVQQAVNKLDVPAGLDVQFGGAASDIDEGFTDLFVAILIAIVLVYSIMGLLFRSWIDPLVILASLPLAAIGAIVSLLVTGSALSLSALIGLLMLVGIVVTNAIVLIEFVIMLREERGYTLRDALVAGGLIRLRPILMTASATVLALIPLSLGLTEGMLIAADLGRVVIGGLVSSTLLTLLVVPVLYSLADDLKRKLAHRQTRTQETPLHPAPEAAS